MDDPVREKLRAIKTFTSLIEYLRDELDWPIESENFDDLTFDYEPDELGIDEKSSAKINVIKQLRPLVTNQPWGIFFIEFEPKRLPVVALRRILRSLVIKQRTSRKQAAHPSWNLHDLLFISNYGEGNNRQITFAHFSEENNGSLPTLRVLGWDDADTALHIDHVHAELKDHMSWPKDDTNIEAWREQWSSVFTLRHREVITTSKALAEKLADLAKRIRKRTNHILAIEISSGPLRQLHSAFKKALIHDLSEDDFADMYAQTITYGLLTARVSRPAGVTPDTLPAMVPVTNPFLKEMLETFLTVGGRKGKIDFDELGIHEVVDILNSPNTHIEDVLRDFGNRTRQEDPVIHFYEFFLKEYDAKKKIKRGVFYTPQPVVSYIVRSVHELLQTEFGLEDGLASTITWGEIIHLNSDISIPKGISSDEPFVMILDPATGTATFLVEVIDVIHTTMTEKWKSLRKPEREINTLWNKYVPTHLLPRLFGYELMMAPYAIAHMKIGLKLHETGYHFGSDARANVYLTNSLEPPSTLAADEAANLFEALGHEAQAVNEVKRNKRFTVVIGNPPYSGHSVNNQIPWIVDKVYDYKRGLPDLNKPAQAKWLQDDYVKFLRFGQWLIESSDTGVLGYITNHSYFDNPTFRGMRKHLYTTFHLALLHDLHGNVKKREKAPDGLKDDNVFDIQQGVAISLYARKPHHIKSRDFLHIDFFGERKSKYKCLQENTQQSIDFTSITPREPFFFFMPQDESLRNEYNAGRRLPDIFCENGDPAPGIVTTHDKFAIAHTKNDILGNVEALVGTATEEEARQLFKLCGQNQWNYRDAKRELTITDCNKLAVPILYRPFDVRWTIYSRYVSVHRRERVMSHMLAGQNIGLVCTRQKSVQSTWALVFVADQIIESCYISNITAEINYLLPLYLYPKAKSELFEEEIHERKPNLDTDVINKLEQILMLDFITDGQGDLNKTLGPEDIFHYIYAVFHSPTYRTRYAEFLKYDFPRLPLTSSLELFHSISSLGGELVSLHLMESLKLNNHITRFFGTDYQLGKRIGGKGKTLENLREGKGRVYLNDASYFDGVPEDVWNFHIGGYQVCHKWLDDRRKAGRSLSDEDIEHYHRIVVALKETIQIMGKIDEVIEEHGGWPGAFVKNTEEKV